ncbi:hypothetical protein ACFYYN_18190 [Streptomyces sp. NPDC001902]
MRAKRSIAIMASPVAAAALAFSPALMTQAAADTTNISATTTSRAAHLPADDASEGKTKGAKDGKRDGLNFKCDYRHSYAPAKATEDYKDAYDLAYRSSYDNYCRGEAAPNTPAGANDASEGKAKGAKDGKRDALTLKCDYRHSYAPAKATEDYKDAYDLAYRTSYDNYC